jgi:hypothetical protein
MNSLLPLNSATNKRNNLTSLFTPTSTTNIMKNSSAPSSFISLSLIIVLAVLTFLGALGYYYRGQVTDTWNNAIDVVNGYFLAKLVEPDSAASTLLSMITSEVPLAAKNDSKLSRGKFQSPTGS